jgi:hypothetical protein
MGPVAIRLLLGHCPLGRGQPFRVHRSRRPTGQRKDTRSVTARVRPPGVVLQDHHSHSAIFTHGQQVGGAFDGYPGCGEG